MLSPSAACFHLASPFALQACRGKTTDTKREIQREREREREREMVQWGAHPRTKFPSLIPVDSHHLSELLATNYSFKLITATERPEGLKGGCKRSLRQMTNLTVLPSMRMTTGIISN